MNNTPGFDGLLREIEQIINSHRDDELDEILERICAVLKDAVSHYDWVGFYLVDPDAEAELILGPYVGAPTEHTRIPFGKGICGQAAATESTFIVQDVTQETNYLSCSPNVRSEIVVPILKGSVVVGELDIDSHALAPFTDQDQAFLDALCVRVAPLL
ncbi:MAG: GAF domain-containing protein [Anaerolineae bacterium]|nr:GAF domain-containing protein [Anaerolineae bacterium]